MREVVNIICHQIINSYLIFDIHFTFQREPILGYILDNIILQFSYTTNNDNYSPKHICSEGGGWEKIFNMGMRGGNKEVIMYYLYVSYPLFS